MKSKFYPCSRCQRHVRVDETECPFCGSELAAPAEMRQWPTLPKQRLSSLAVVTFRTAMIGAVAGACGGLAEEHTKHADAGPDVLQGDGGSTSAGGRRAVGSGGSGGSGADSSLAGNGNSPAAGSSNPDFDAGIDPYDPYDGGPIPIYRATPRG